MGKTTAERVKEHRKRLKEQNEEKWKTGRKKRIRKKGSQKSSIEEKSKKVRTDEEKRS